MPEFGSSVRKPVIVYHKELDQIEVKACRRCGIEKACDGCVTEIPGGTLLTLLEGNFPSPEFALVGFIVRNARDFCERNHLMNGDEVELHRVLSSLVFGTHPHNEQSVEVARTALRRLDTTCLQLLS